MSVRTGTPTAALANRRRFSFWAIAFAFLILLAFSTAPSPLYVLYAQRDHFSSFMITLIYGAYALGVVASLFLIGHLSDVYGRRPHLLAAVALAATAALVFILAPGLGGLFAARILTGISVGLTVPTATAYLTEMHAERHGHRHGVRPQLTSTVVNLGGLSLGALIAGSLAQYEPHRLTTTYLVLLVLLLAATVAITLSLETRQRRRPAPPYRPQRASAPERARPEFFAALTGVFLAYAAPAVFVGLAGTFLATAVHDTSLATAGLTIFILFAVGVTLLMATTAWPAGRLLVGGVSLDIVGLTLLVISAWLPTPSLALFLIAGGCVGAGASALFKGTLGTVISISAPDKLGESLTGFFLSGYFGLSLPAIAVGIALQFISLKDTLLAFAIIVSLGILSALRPLLGSQRAAPSAEAGVVAGTSPAADPSAVR
jgi:MFS family permease